MARSTRTLELPPDSSGQAAHLLDLAFHVGGVQPWRLSGHPAKFHLPEPMARLHRLEGEGPWPTAEVLAAYDDPARERFQSALQRCQRRGSGMDLLLPLIDERGERHALRWLSAEGGSTDELVGVLKDDTVAQHQHWRQQVQARHLAAVSAGQPMEQVLESLLEDFEAHHPGSIGSVLLIDQSASTVHHGAGGRLPEAYRIGVEGAPVGAAAGSCGTAAHRAERVIVADIANDPLWADYAELALAHGLRACWSTPVMDGRDRVLATFAIYYREVRHPTEGELEDIDALAAMAALAVGQSALLQDQRHLMDSAAEVICVFDERGRFVGVNREAEELWGRTQESLIGQSVDLLVHGDDQARTRSEMIDVMAGRPARDFPNRNIAAGGRVVHMLWSATWSPENRRMYCFGRDVTAQRIAQERLRLLERAIESSRNGVMIADARAGDFPILYANAAMERISGYPREAFAGRNCRFLQGGDRNQPQRAVLREALLAGKECNVVLRNYRADGSLFWNELSLAPVLDDSGAVSHFLGVSIDITERRRFEEELARAMSHDAVTDLPRYAATEQQLVPGQAGPGAAGQEWWLLFIDLDHFHSVNETMGDQVGDLVLRQIAERLRDTLGGLGRLSRFAGDEFVAVVPDLDQDVVLALADSLRRAVAAPISGAPFELQLTASIGISGHPDHGRTPGELLRRAEAAMAQAKRDGRDGVRLYSESDMQHVEDRLALGVHLRGAVQRDELELHYQPQVAAEDGRLLGLEALVRWTRSPLGPVPPGRFIPIAEALGLMPEVGDRVLQLACAQLQAWSAAGLPPTVVAINVSAQQLLREGFANSVERALREYQVPRGCLQFELTESSLMESLQRVHETLDRLRGLGISLALDDFGTGYSSLSYLKRFNFDKLKIDRSFVSDLRSEGSDAAIARTIIAIGHELGMRVSAEGVETPSQRQLLCALGCDELQGYLLGRPQPAEQLEAMMRTGYVDFEQLEREAE
jgi:diguanylate cyclase (GGDEF)-like protein/PAS domain S-box-containing protein